MQLMAARYTTGMSKASILLVLLMLPQAVSAASLSIDTDAQTYGVGDTFIATVRVDNEGECVNAAEVEIEYPTDLLRAVDFSRGDSILTLWVQEPAIDTAAGKVTFAGGIPGGYCGHISGDPSQSDILGRIVFSVVGDEKREAAMNLALASRVYLHDGLGTPARLSLRGRTLALVDAPTLSGDPWLSEVGADKTSPEPFAIDIESTSGTFGGKYFAVFSTTDKQSGLDHYEIWENGAWQRVVSPHVLKDQSLAGGVRLRAIDKAGNQRDGDFDPASVPPRQYSATEYLSVAALILIALIATVVRLALARRSRRAREAAAL